MALSDGDWQEIMKFVNQRVASVGDYFVQGKVVKRDTKKKLVWLKEFGDQPIPLIAFDFQVRYYIVNANSDVVPKIAGKNDVELLTPGIGETVLVARYMGSRHLPKCLGVVQSTGYVTE